MAWDTVQNWFGAHPLVGLSAIILGVLLASWLGYLITKRYILRILSKLASRSKTELDNLILDRVISRRLAYIVPILMIYLFVDWIQQYGDTAQLQFLDFFQQVLIGIIIFIILLSAGALLNVLSDILQRLPVFKDKPLKSYVQVVKLLLYIIGGILVLSVIIGTSPLALLGGFGAMTAVLILVFRDTILSFLASIHITSYDLIRVGDWIEVRKYGADGDVIDIALHTIKIQNWDKTISVIPTHKILEDSFINWRGMQQSGGRRIKRAVYIDIASIKFCDERMVEKFKRIDLLKDYIERKTEELQQYNQAHQIDNDVLVNGRRMTNIGTFRAYVEAYLRNHPRINRNLTFLIRQLAPGPTGIGIEIYVFADDVVWRNYEAIQADIFDHILAVVPEFELRVYQNPAGYDMQGLVRSLSLAEQRED